MTRKENVKNAIHFKKPVYIPLMYYGTEPKRMAKSDILMIGVQNMYGGEDGLTAEWGFSWHDSENVSHRLGVIKEPAIKDWSELGRYKPLNPDIPGRFDNAIKIMNEYTDRYYIAEFALSGFTVASFIRGFEEFLMDLYLEPQNAEKLLDIVFETEMRLMKSCADNGFDAVILADDWGTQESLLISLDLFRTFFAPRYKRQIDYAHTLGLDVFLHSCGRIESIVSTLVDMGLDVLNPGQPKLNHVEKLGEMFAGRICFACPIGYQTTAINGTKEDIENEVLQYVNCLTADKGGLIGFVASENALCQLGASKENARFVTTAFERYCGCR